MSISQLLQPNSYNLYASKLNDISGQEISVSNENGQVLTIVDKVNKTVAFTNVSVPDPLPSTTGEPDGYVLGIKNNLTGELEWKQDAQGSIPDPLVLSGTDSVNKFQVRDSGNTSLFTVDTVNSQILLNEQTLIQGIDDTVKFGVYNDTDNAPEFVVDTVNHQIKIGSINSTEKFNIKDVDGNNVLNVDSVNHGCNIVNNAGNKNITMTTQGLMGPEIVVDSSSDTDAFSRLQVKNSSIDGGTINILAFPSGNGTSISTNGPLNMNSYQVNINGETYIRTSAPKENHFVCEDIGGVDYFKVDSLNGIVTSSLKTEVSGSAVKGKFTVKNSIADSILTVNTDGDIGTVLIANGTNNANKFVVRNVAENDIIRIDTTNDRIESRGKLLLNGDNNNYKLLVKNNNSNDVFRVDSVTSNAYFGDSNNGSNVTQIEPNIAKQIIYGSGTNSPTLLLKNLTQTSELSLVATANAQPNKLISNKPLNITAGGDITLNGNSGSNLSIGDGNITTTSNFIIDGAASSDKFLVKDEQGNKIFWVETTSDSIYLGGSNSGAKWGVFDIDFNLVYLLDTNGSIMRLQNAGATEPVMIVNYNTATFSAEVRDNFRRAGMIAKSNTVGGGELRVQSGGATSSNIIQSTSSLGFDITSNNGMTINGGTQITITSPCDFSTNAPTTSIVPTIDNSLTNKIYVDTKVGNLYVGTADTANVNNGSIVPTGLGTLTIPANGFNIGDSFHLVMAGVCTFTAGQTITITLVANAIVIGTIVVSTESTATPPNPWELEGDFTIRSIGVTASVVINFDFTYVGTNQNAFVGGRSVEVNTINTTISNTLGVTAVCSNGGDTIITRLMYLKKMF